MGRVQGGHLPHGVEAVDLDVDAGATALARRNAAGLELGTGLRAEKDFRELS